MSNTAYSTIIFFATGVIGVLLMIASAKRAETERVVTAPKNTHGNWDAWFKRCAEAAYKDGYSLSAVENLSRTMFMDYFTTGLSPEQAIETYFSEE